MAEQSMDEEALADVFSDCQPDESERGLARAVLASAWLSERDAQVREDLARALLTIATVESAVQKIERYLESNGRYLPLEAKVPMRAQTEAMRNALNAWKADRG